MAEKIYRELANSIQRVITYEPEKRRAKLGYVYQGTYTIVDPDDQRFYFARFTDGGFVRARHYGKISPVADADVIVIKEKGGHRLEPVVNQWETGENTNVGSSVGYHTHVRGSIFQFEIDTWMLLNLRPTLDNGMVLSVGEGFYKHAGELNHFNGDTIDLTSAIPVTSGHHAWVVVGLDPNSQALTAYTGTSIFTFVDLDQADIAAIDIGDDIAIAALDIANADTEIAESTIVDLRLMPDNAPPLVSSTSNVVTLVSGAGVLSAKYSYFLIAAETGTADDLVTLTMTGSPRLILLQADAGDTITVKHNTGNIKLASGLDYALSNDKTLCLFWDGTNLADTSPAHPITPLIADLDFDGFNAVDVNTLNLDDSTELTIASGAVTVTQSWHRVDTESNAASDYLDTINGGADGSLLYIKAENTTRTVILRHAVGNIRMLDEQNITLNTDEKCVALIYDQASSCWLAIALYNSSSGGGGGSGYFSGTAFDIEYAPTFPDDWSLLPANVGEALDELAATGGGGGSLTVKETDGTPSVSGVGEIRVANNLLTDIGGGVVSIARSRRDLYNEPDGSLMSLSPHYWAEFDGSSLPGDWSVAGGSVTVGPTADAGRSCIEIEMNTTGGSYVHTLTSPISGDLDFETKVWMDTFSTTASSNGMEITLRDSADAIIMSIYFYHVSSQYYYQTYSTFTGTSYASGSMQLPLLMSRSAPFYFKFTRVSGVAAAYHSWDGENWNFMASKASVTTTIDKIAFRPYKQAGSINTKARFFYARINT